MIDFQSIFSHIPFVPLMLILGSLLYWVPAFFLVYHLNRFGVGIRPKAVALVFIIGSVILFGLMIWSLTQLSWFTFFSQ